MSAHLRIALAQLNPTVGDIDGNVELIVDAAARAREAGAQLVVVPELSVTGYPPEDLLLKRHFLRHARLALEEVAERCEGIVAVVGFPEGAEDVYNSAAILAEGKVQGIYRKIHLPNYGVFDEQRYFRSGRVAGVIDIGEVRVGVTICEDMWQPGAPASDAALAGATVIVNASASPYHAGKGAEREEMFRQRARDNVAAVAYCNLVGGQDELVFDGQSLVVDHRGEVLARGTQFEEELIVCDLDAEAPAAARLRDARHRSGTGATTHADLLARLDAPMAQTGQTALCRVAEPLPREAEVYAALTVGLRDYVDKNGFEKVVLGLSGGIDSALVACVAADALGAERVAAVVMPSPYSSPETQADARAIAANLGTECIELPVEAVMRAYDQILAEPFAGTEPGIAEENLQARIRGNLLMALSNKFGWLVLATGNKSEMSVGYSTLYGDLAGGFAVIKDVPKTLVYALVRHRNAAGDPPPVPASVVERAPSAELRPDQRDEDSLPPYPVLDPIVEGYVEDDLSREELVGRGFAAEDVERVIGLVDRAEYKRRQAPPGIKISTKAFGRDRRMPITNRYRGQSAAVRGTSSEARP